MKTCKLILIFAFLVILLTSGCGCNQEGPTGINLFEKQDSTPPKLLSAQAVDTTCIKLIFSEDIQGKTINLLVNGVKTTNLLCRGETILLYLTTAMDIASSARLEGRVEDFWGNSTRFSLSVWAHNPNRAEVLINEFSTKGSGNNPDRVELLVTKAGNLAGLTVANGVGPLASDRCILGDKWVYQGDFVVIGFQEGGTEALYPSENLGGLSSNNGCITVTESPDWESTILDAVIYSNKTTTTFSGFGSRETELGASQLYESGVWNSSLAEEAVDSTDSTATRSICRENYTDTNSQNDWYICDTKGASFGRENSPTRYAGQ